MPLLLKLCWFHSFRRLKPIQDQVAVHCVLFGILGILVGNVGFYHEDRGLFSVSSTSSSELHVINFRQFIFILDSGHRREILVVSQIGQLYIQLTHLLEIGALQGQVIEPTVTS